MFFRKWFAVPFVGEEYVVIVTGLEREVRGVIVIGFEEDELCE